MKNYAMILCGMCIFLYLLVICKYELQMMQQNSYRNNRYFRWLKTDVKSFRRITDWIIFTALLFLAENIAILIFSSAVLIVKAILELKKKYKKKLVFTTRAIRLYITSCIILIFITGLSVVIKDLSTGIAAAMLSAALSPCILLLANLINLPVEKSINRWYYQDAKKILSAFPNLIVIGITGSYGKTSTKHYLFRILSEKYNVLMTPGSYNTTLGVVRTIREQLKPYHNIFIVEMGAKQPGDIEDICKLVKPGIGILTAVGEQHLESFKSIERVQKTKFELIDSLPFDGLAVLNNDFEYVSSREVKNVSQVVRYSSCDTQADYRLSNISYSIRGTDFHISNTNGETEKFITHLAGNYNLSNILASYIVAQYLNVDTESIRYAIEQIEQVEHRLNIKRTPAGITIIDDAFNSNPHGAKMALEVLQSFNTGKRIVITPGLIELGKKQYDYNYQFGRQIAHSCDYAVIVGLYNREAILKGLNDSSFAKENLFLANTFNEAVNQLNTIIKPGDIVLYENDLPDTFK